MDIVEKLRNVQVNTIHWVKCHDAADEIERLREALRDICEVYAGSEGIPKPMTAAEGYLLKRLMEAVRIASKTLGEKE
jgi:hypothetical protein